MDNTVSSNSFSREDLAGKRVALIGFSPEEASPFQKLLDGANAFCRLMSQQDASASGLRPFDLAIIRLDDNEISPLLSDKEASQRVPFLLIGSSAAVQSPLCCTDHAASSIGPDAGADADAASARPVTPQAAETRVRMAIIKVTTRHIGARQGQR